MNFECSMFETWLTCSWNFPSTSQLKNSFKSILGDLEGIFTKDTLGLSLKLQHQNIKQFRPIISNEWTGISVLRFDPQLAIFACTLLTGEMRMNVHLGDSCEEEINHSSQICLCYLSVLFNIQSFCSSLLQIFRLSVVLAFFKSSHQTIIKIIIIN